MSFGVPLCVVPVWGLRCSNFCSYFERRERRGDVAKNRSAWEKQFVNPFTSWIFFQLIYTVTLIHWVLLRIQGIINCIQMAAIFLRCHPQDGKLDYPFAVFQVRINLSTLRNHYRFTASWLTSHRKDDWEWVEGYIFQNKTTNLITN